MAIFVPSPLYCVNNHLGIMMLYISRIIIIIINRHIMLHDKTRFFELDPPVDKWFPCACRQNGNLES